MQHPRLPCPSPAPAVCSNSYALRWWCHPTTSPDKSLILLKGSWSRNQSEACEGSRNPAKGRRKAALPAIDLSGHAHPASENRDPTTCPTALPGSLLVREPCCPERWRAGTVSSSSLPLPSASFPPGSQQSSDDRPPPLATLRQPHHYWSSPQDKVQTPGKVPSQGSFSTHLSLHTAPSDRAEVTQFPK